MSNQYLGSAVLVAALGLPACAEDARPNEDTSSSSGGDEVGGGGGGGDDAEGGSGGGGDASGGGGEITDADGDGVDDGADCAPDDATRWQTVGAYVDEDGDGHGVGSELSLCIGDALDAGHVAAGDNLGEDCNDDPNAGGADAFQLLDGYVDADGDGYGDASAAIETLCTGQTLPSTHTSDNTDCNDDAVTGAGVYQLLSGYPDADQDSFGDASAAIQQVCSGATLPPSHVLDNTDCDDDPTTGAGRYQLLSGYPDADQDGYGNAGAALVAVCSGLTLPSSHVLDNTDCNDDPLSGGAAVHTTTVFYPDADGDGFGAASGTAFCLLSAPVGYTTDSTDCNDDPSSGGAAVHALASFNIDGDGDGYGSTALGSVCALTPPSGFADNGTDCNDGDGTVYQYLSGYTDQDGDAWRVGTELSVCSGASIATGHVATASVLGDDCNDDDAAETLCILRVINRVPEPFPTYRRSYVMHVQEDGVILDDMVMQIDQKAKELAWDEDGDMFYSTNRHYELWETDAGGTTTVITPVTPDISWPSGSAFDSQRGRLLVSGRLSFNIFDPATSDWTELSVGNFELETMAYDDVNDELYATSDTAKKTTLYRLNLSDGSIFSTITYDTPLSFEDAQPSYAISGQLVARGGRLFMYMSSPDSLIGSTVPTVTRAFFEIDPDTGETWEITLD